MCIIPDQKIRECLDLNNSFHHKIVIYSAFITCQVFIVKNSSNNMVKLEFWLGLWLNKYRIPKGGVKLPCEVWLHMFCEPNIFLPTLRVKGVKRYLSCYLCKKRRELLHNPWIWGFGWQNALRQEPDRPIVWWWSWVMLTWACTPRVFQARDGELFPMGLKWQPGEISSGEHLASCLTLP